MTATAYGPRTPLLTAARVTRLAKEVLPGVRVSTERGADCFLTRVWTGDGELRMLNQAAARIREAGYAATVVSGGSSHSGRAVYFRVKVTDPRVQEAAEEKIGRDRAAALAEAQAEVAAAQATRTAPLAVVTLDGQDAEVTVTATPAQPAVPSSLTAGPAAREAGSYAVGGTRGELVSLHADPAAAVRHAEQVRAAGFGASVYGPCGHPLREYLSRDGVRELEACRRCVQVQQAADVLRAGGRLTGGLRAANVETEARALLTAEEDALTCGTCGRGADSGYHQHDHPFTARRVTAEPAEELRYRSIRARAYEVLRGGQVIGRVLRTPHSSDVLRWEAYLPGGGSVGTAETRTAAARLLTPPPAEPAYGCVQHIERGPECGPECTRLTAAYGSSPASREVVQREAATVPCWHVETAHGALYGVAAHSLRDALQMTQDRLTEERSPDLPKRGQRVGTWRTAYGTVLCYRGPA